MLELTLIRLSCLKQQAQPREPAAAAGPPVLQAAIAVACVGDACNDSHQNTHLTTYSVQCPDRDFSSFDNSEDV